MFGVGLPEFAVILMVAAIAFGPDKLPDHARKAARLLHALRQAVKATQDDLRGELGPEFADLNLSDLDPRTLLRKHVLESDEVLVDAEQPAPPTIEAEHREAG